MQILQMVLFGNMTEQKIALQEHNYFADRNIQSLIAPTRDHTSLSLCRKCWHFSNSQEDHGLQGEGVVCTGSQTNGKF